jgi:protein-S-isoprenylcysteine O-methyltransferase Ste14
VSGAPTSGAVRPPLSPRARVALAVAWGAVNHGAFVVAIVAMVVALHGGMRSGLGRLDGPAAWAANALLVAQFPLLHSYLLSKPGQAWLRRCAPRELSRALAPTVFTTVASFQLLAVALLWTPSGVTLHEATGAALWLFRGAFAASWALLAKTLYDAKLPIQTGSIGWTAALRGEQPDFGDFPREGTFRRCRQPVYLAFALTLWTGPVHTLDGLLLALAWSVYCFAAPLHKELRYLSIHGERFSRYRGEVPYILPRFRKT